jgi:hypothetical protein
LQPRQPPAGGHGGLTAGIVWNLFVYRGKAILQLVTLSSDLCQDVGEYIDVRAQFIGAKQLWGRRI